MSETLVPGRYSLSRHVGPTDDPERPGERDPLRYQITTLGSLVVLTTGEMLKIALAVVMDQGVSWSKAPKQRKKRKWRYSRRSMAGWVNDLQDEGRFAVSRKLLEREP
ncbi:MAG: hypothetical protein ACREN7_00075 [Candidatus Dormibacteria bacterium]